MSWDEKLFSIFYNFAIKSKNSLRTQNPILSLETVKRQSEVFLSALCETKVEIRESSGWGGFQGRVLFLPETVDFFNSMELNILYLEWRLLAAYADVQLKGLPHSEAGIQAVLELFPQWKNSFSLLKAALDKENKSYDFDFWLGISQGRALSSGASLLEGDSQMNADSGTPEDSLSAGSEINGKTKDRATVVQVNEKEDTPLMHVFEKVFTAEDYQGGQRKMDGSDELEIHSQALNELNLSHVIRTNQSSKSVLKSNAIVEIQNIEGQEKEIEFPQACFHYPEWFSGKRIYQKDWCTVYECKVPESAERLPFNKAIAEKLRNKMETVVNSYQWHTRQKEGPEIDINLALDRYIRAKAREGVLPDRIYRMKVKENHDFAIQILVDSSLSSESYALGRRIIDTTQEALNIFSSAFDGVLDLISIAAFHSHTRNRVQYSVLKEFDEDWKTVPLRISSLKPEGYTRIGPALRHSRARLDKVKAKKKLLLFISDAKPTDYDYYEGQHGIDDIQRAVTELQSSQCKIKVLTLTDKKHSHHNYVFGANNCRILKSVQDLSDSLFEFWYQSVK